MWLFAAFIYRRTLKINLLAYAKYDEPETFGHIGGPDPVPLSFIKESGLPSDATLFAIKAEEHYIRIWSDQRTDLVRHRFKDAVHEL